MRSEPGIIIGDNNSKATVVFFWVKASSGRGGGCIGEIAKMNIFFILAILPMHHPPRPEEALRPSLAWIEISVTHDIMLFTNHKQKLMEMSFIRQSEQITKIILIRQTFSWKHFTDTMFLVKYTPNTNGMFESWHYYSSIHNTDSTT